jgi:FADH2 O2-dependent halogenase
MKRFQIVVVGSGFAGSLMAMIAQRLGFSTALVERHKHPRFAIGESSTPLANLLLEEIADTYDLPFVRPLSKWGTWQRHLPQIVCGLKRGFTFYHHELGKPFAPDPNLKRQLLVGASASESVADTHWYRPDFDQYLVTKAQEIGVTYLDETNLTAVREEEKKISLSGTRHGEPIDLSADFLIDATGPRGFLHHALKLWEKSVPLLPPTQALFAHFKNVAPLPGAFQASNKTPPYPPEQAAVHHVFPGGWIWILKFNNGITSAGVAATDRISNQFNFQKGEPAWRGLLDQLPSIAEIFSNAKATTPFIHQPRLAFQSATLHGPRWTMLPSAAGFVDPLLSTGFPLTLFGITRLASILGTHWEKPSFALQIQNYTEVTARELEATAILIAALYATMNRFELFKQLSLLYFAAAHYSETQRRSGKAHLADSFLLASNANFSRELREIRRLAVQPLIDEKALIDRVRQTIKPYDLIGFTDPDHGPWYSAV